MEMSVVTIIEKAKNVDLVVIVGAGMRGKELLDHFEDRGVRVAMFFDNNQELIGSTIREIKIVKAYKIENKNCFYIIAMDGILNQESVRSQLISLGISNIDITTYDYNCIYDYLSNLDEKDYKEALQKRYYKIFGRKINWDYPVTYNEKINCDKLKIHNDIRAKLVDKLMVKNWVKEKIGEEYVTRLYAVWDTADDINFEDLPNSFVLKVNNGSGRNIIVKDKQNIDKDLVRKQLGIWLSQNFAYVSLELQYKDVVPKIICEEYLEGVAEEIYDYNIYCFHGEPEYIWCIKGSHRPGCKASFYNKKWEMQPFSYGYPKDEEVAPAPAKLDEMLKLSRILCEDFEHVRVDWYNLPDGRVLFGEMTFTSWSGLRRFEPDEYDTVFGNLI
ncbi:MAG: hypothetical protein HFJ07_19760 [Lachnospiraceae bacterium]|nr:hypothetical protein [Lachnospiraceae bacterium]